MKLIGTQRDLQADRYYLCYWAFPDRQDAPKYIRIIKMIKEVNRASLMYDVDVLYGAANTGGLRNMDFRVGN